MHTDSALISTSEAPHRLLADRLISLADDTNRAGLRREAVMILAMAYSVLDGQDYGEPVHAPFERLILFAPSAEIGC